MSQNDYFTDVIYILGYQLKFAYKSRESLADRSNGCRLKNTLETRKKRKNTERISDDLSCLPTPKLPIYHFRYKSAPYL